MDPRWNALLASAMNAADVPHDARPECVESLRQHPDYKAIVSQYRIGASDRALGNLLSRMIGQVRGAGAHGG